MRLLAASLALALLIAAPNAWAKSSDRQQPMDVEADRTDALLADDSETTLSGNVRITQGTLKVEADTAVVHRVKGEIAKVVLSGGPVRLSQIADNGEAMNATARQVVYTLTSDVVVLTGNVLIEQARGNLRGETVKYDLASGRIDGGGDGSRVSMRIQPKTAATPEN